MRKTINANRGDSNNGLAPTMKLVIALVFSLTVALLNMTQRPALQPAQVHVNESASALTPVNKDAPKIAAPAPQATPKPFNAADPTTWPTCAPGEIVRADNGQCAAAPAPAPTMPAAVASTGVAGGSGSCAAEIAKYGWNYNTALAVAQAESGLNPGNLNNNPATGDYSVGCFQINIYGANARTRPSEGELKNAAVNVAWAHKIYTGNGNSFIGQWGVCRSKVACY